MHTTRRSFIAGCLSLLVAPAIVKVDSLMSLRSSPLRFGFDIGVGDATIVAIPRRFATYTWVKYGDVAIGPLMAIPKWGEIHNIPIGDIMKEINLALA